MRYTLSRARCASKSASSAASAGARAGLARCCASSVAPARCFSLSASTDWISFLSACSFFSTVVLRGSPPVGDSISRARAASTTLSPKLLEQVQLGS